MVTLQLKAPVGYGVRQMVAQLLQQRNLKAVWCSSVPEIRRNIEHSIGLPTISPRQLSTELTMGYSGDYRVVIVSDISRYNWNTLRPILQEKGVETWLVNMQE